MRNSQLVLFVLSIHYSGPAKSVDDGTAIWGEQKKIPNAQSQANTNNSGNFNQPRNQSWGNEGTENHSLLTFSGIFRLSELFCMKTITFNPTVT